MDRVVHFEIAAKDIEKAKAFYEDVFGWKFEKWGGDIDYWLITTGPDDKIGINGGMTPKMTEGLVEEGLDINDSSRAINATITMSVESLDEANAKIERAGGRVVTDKMEVMGIGWLSYFKDLDDNLLGLMEWQDTEQ